MTIVLSASRFLRVQAIFILAALLALTAAAKDKKKALLPADVLQAKTVFVVVDPQAGMSIEDPTANRVARGNVEQAIQKWGRFELAVDESTADLVIVVRKGNGHTAQPTIGSVPSAGDSGGGFTIAGGGPPASGNPNDSSAGAAHPQAEIGPAEDMFVVYRGKRDHPLSGPPVWRYMARNALNAPNVPAVDVFRKLFEDSEKQLAQPQPAKP